MKPGKIEIRNLNADTPAIFRSENLEPTEIVLHLMFSIVKISQHYNVPMAALEAMLQQMVADPDVRNIGELQEGLTNYDD
ncbi:hypothetical protein KTE19_11745 [Lentilactobacillus sp. IMAU92037]|uniref:hypothetical protein n=1 Tax=Lentilactobacillus dabitei TaxID=2831523 RepID=UPI001C2C450C|nr:hypothetical protein [Lentilactobacillus dabitei]MBV0931359.1 hypothetical protein [Lentilactobacillus dabitei]